jgi:hypothetical protein
MWNSSSITERLQQAASQASRLASTGINTITEQAQAVAPLARAGPEPNTNKESATNSSLYLSSNSDEQVLSNDEVARLRKIENRFIG